jgi:hypothetical protein
MQARRSHRARSAHLLFHLLLQLLSSVFFSSSQLSTTRAGCQVPSMVAEVSRAPLYSSSLCYRGVAGGGVAVGVAADSCAKGAAWWPTAMVAEVLVDNGHLLFD